MRATSGAVSSCAATQRQKIRSSRQSGRSSGPLHGARCPKSPKSSSSGRTKPKRSFSGPNTIQLYCTWSSAPTILVARWSPANERVGGGCHRHLRGGIRCNSLRQLAKRVRDSTMNNPLQYILSLRSRRAPQRSWPARVAHPRSIICRDPSAVLGRAQRRTRHHAPTRVRFEPNGGGKEIIVALTQLSGPLDPFGARLLQKQKEKVRDSLGAAIRPSYSSKRARSARSEEKERRRREEQERAALERGKKSAANAKTRTASAEESEESASLEREKEREYQRQLLQLMLQVQKGPQDRVRVL